MQSLNKLFLKLLKFSLKIIIFSVTLRRTFPGIFLQNMLPNILLSIIVFSSNLYYQQRFDAAVPVNVTCLLAMSGYFIAIFRSLPKQPGMKFMDWFQIKCISFSTLAILFQVLDIYNQTRKHANKSKVLKNLMDRILKISIYWVIPMIGIGIDIVFICVGVLYDYKLVSFN